MPMAHANTSTIQLDRGLEVNPPEKVRCICALIAMIPVRVIR